MDDIDNSQLYLGVRVFIDHIPDHSITDLVISILLNYPLSQFDFQVEDVPERDPSQVRSATMETSDILETLKTEMVGRYVYL